MDCGCVTRIPGPEGSLLPVTDSLNGRISSRHQYQRRRGGRLTNNDAEGAISSKRFSSVKNWAPSPMNLLATPEQHPKIPGALGQTSSGAGVLSASVGLLMK